MTAIGHPGEVTIDNPTLVTEVVRHGLVDRIDVLLCPVELGGRLRFLPDHRRNLAVRHQQGFGNGMIQLRYDVLHQDLL